MLEKFEQGHPAPLPFAAGDANPAGVAALKVAVLLGQLERWLALQHGRPAGADLLAQLRQFQASYGDAAAGWRQALTDFMTLMADWLAVYVVHGDTDTVGDLTRLGLVGGLVTAYGNLLDDAEASGPEAS